MISIYTRNSIDGPSDYYRVMQYLNVINCRKRIHNALPKKLFRLNLDIKSGKIKKFIQFFLYVLICIRRVISIIQDIVSPPNLIIIEREVFPRRLSLVGALFLKYLMKLNKVIWDFDDDIWGNELSVEEGKLLIRYSEHIVTISEYLKALLPISVAYKVITLPTTDKIVEENEISQIISNRIKSFVSEIRLVWVGTASNLDNIDLVTKEFENVAVLFKTVYRKNLILTLVCNKKYSYSPQNYIIRNVVWSKSNAKEELLKAHIGIMPLIDTNFSKGKGGFKLVQYMSTSLPTIASNVGFNKEIIENKVSGYLIDDKYPLQWLKAITIISQNIESWKYFSLNAYKRYKEKFSYERNFAFWDDMIRSYTKGKN